MSQAQRVAPSPPFRRDCSRRGGSPCSVSMLAIALGATVNGVQLQVPPRVTLPPPRNRPCARPPGHSAPSLSPWRFQLTSLPPP